MELFPQALMMKRRYKMPMKHVLKLPGKRFHQTAFTEREKQLKLKLQTRI